MRFSKWHHPGARALSAERRGRGRGKVFLIIIIGSSTACPAAGRAKRSDHHQRRLVLRRPRVEHLLEVRHGRLVDASPIGVDLQQSYEHGSERQMGKQASAAP